MHPLLEKKGFIIDIDGVIGRGETPIPEGVKAVNLLKEMGKKIIFVSNNSTRSRRIMMDRFRRFGVNDVDENELLLATFATARFVSREKKNAKIFTTGEAGLIEELELAGHEIVDYKDAEYLVVGSNRGVNFELLTKARDEFEKVLALHKKGDEKAAIRHLVRASSFWTHATWLEFLEQQAIKAAPPETYRPLPE
jgi:4-nitrophenyl phosphatase